MDGTPIWANKQKIIVSLESPGAKLRVLLPKIFSMITDAAAKNFKGWRKIAQQGFNKLLIT
jgi:hypothetical protein